MKLRIDAIHNHGDVNSEHVAMTVLEDTNLHWHMIMDTSYHPDHHISNVFRHTKWFPDTPVNAGDRVSLWSGKGRNHRFVNDAGVVWHRVYWGSDSAIWNDEGDAAVLFEVTEWKTTRAR